MKIKDLVAKTCQYDPKKDYYTEVINDTLYVYFHASHSKQDWLRNFFFWTTRFNGLKIHAGYYEEFTDLWTDELFNKILHYKKRVFIGYSRGAAVILILVALLKHLYIYTSNDKTVIIGAPRVFRKFPYFLTIPNVIEVCYGNDIVRKLLFWYSENPCTSFIHIPSTVTGWFKACKDHGQYTTVDTEIDL